MSQHTAAGAAVGAARRAGGWADTFSSLRNPHFRQLLLGSIGSFVAMSMSQIARGYLAYAMTGSAVILGLVSLSMAIPQVVFSLFAGMVVDRMPKRRLLVITQSALALLALFNAVLVQFGWIEVWHLILIGALQGTIFAFNMPCRQSYVPILVPEPVQFANALAINNGTMNLTRVLGPAVAGLLIATPLVGMTGVFYMVAAGYAWAVLTIWRIPVAGEPVRAPRGSVLQEATAGLVTVWQHPRLRVLMTIGFIPLLVGMPYVMLMPVFASAVFNVGSDGLGYLMAANSLGALTGSLFLASISASPHKRWYQLGAGLVWGIGLVLFASVGSFLPALLILPLVGFCQNAFMILNGTLIMGHTPKAVYGRVMSLYMTTFAFLPLAQLPLSVLVDTIGAPAAITIAGLITTAASLGLLGIEVRSRAQASVAEEPEATLAA